MLSLFSSISLTSCKNKKVEINREDLFFTEMYIDDTLKDGILELTINNKNLTSLDGIKVNFYGSKDLAYTYTFDGDKLKSNIVMFVNKDSSYQDDINTIIKLNDNYINGYYYVEVTSNDNQIYDSLGNKGFNLPYVQNQSLVRLKEHFKGSETYNELDFIKVRSGVKSYLGNINSPVTIKELKDGPKLSSIYSNLPYQQDGLGTGGYVEVKLNSLGDGDTTQFDFPKESGIVNNYENRVRYLLIDTPEINHGSGSIITAEPFGEEAKAFNNKRLKEATMIVAQSNKNKTINDSYGRTLAYIWYTSKENPTVNDLILFNNEIVYAGLAKFSTYDKYEDMYYKDILYYDYLDYGAKLAKSQGIKIYGEKDPTFDYDV